MAKDIGFHSILSYSEGSVWVPVGEVIKGWDNESTADMVDTEILGDTFKTFKPASIDPGTVTFEIFLDNGNTNNQFLADAFYNGTLVNWQIEYSNGGEGDEEQFSAYVKSLGRTVEKKTMLTRKITLQITGDPGIAGATVV